MGRPLRLIVATWDGAGNLPPILALVDALLRRGHRVHVLAHEVQREKIEATGAAFLSFDTAPQIDHGQSLGANPLASLLEFDRDASNDLLAACDRLAPDALLRRNRALRPFSASSSQTGIAARKCPNSLGATNPYSATKPRIWLPFALRWLLNSKRTRCTA
jgi:UDP:flavonoid glycosyltransferase YjiC (YdhE family)